MLPGGHHRDVTHAVAFVADVADVELVGGVATANALAPIVERSFIENEGGTLALDEAYPFVAGGLLRGGFSHLFAYGLSAPDIPTPVEPFWPRFDEPVSFDVDYSDAPDRNAGPSPLARAPPVVGHADVEPLHRVAER